MPTFRVTVVNSEFSAWEEHDLPSLDAAKKQGRKAALAMGSDEVRRGKAFFGAEILVEADGDLASRSVVSIGTSPLQ
ncbi:hypothetical protein LZ016_02105 [Sphingomonas sp. SM33]|uniref:DUF1330 domain-containing protein n=1 Tax=Sphingomonas telluris TaxID=2907998 RepID=A0ABS9VK75_9SPHN|nr:hypothetical protein [Sphingomonas telluris]MCH8614899.1 hypothetical protein [Sphingomonas telluris]